MSPSAVPHESVKDTFTVTRELALDIAEPPTDRDRDRGGDCERSARDRTFEMLSTFSPSLHATAFPAASKEAEAGCPP